MGGSVVGGGSIVDAAEAIDFLVQQVVEQASIEDVSLSDPEKRRMWLASDGNRQGDEFASQNLIVYEGKISTLLHHAHRRMQEESSDNLETWRRAIRALRDGDHYLLQLWDILPESEQPSSSALKRIGVGAVIAIAVMIGVIMWIALKHGK
jgi:hypothetical protein